MTGYILRRILIAIPVLIGVLIVVFLLVRLLPGEPCTAMLGERATPEQCAAFDEAYGFNDPLPTQLAIYAQNVLSGDFGESIRYSRPISTMLIERLPVTLELSLAALFIAIIIGIPAGVLAARRHNSVVDIGTMSIANIGVSMPIFWLGLLLAYFFSATLRNTPFALPASGRLSAGVQPIPFYTVWGWSLSSNGFIAAGQQFVSNMVTTNAFISAQWTIWWDSIKHLILPAITLATIPMSIITRMTRSALLDVTQKDYIRTARAKGAGEGRIVRSHAMRNAMLPVVTIIGLQLGALLGGAVLTETVFGLAGVGTALFEGISARDFPIIQGFTLVIAATYVLVNLVVDVSYGYLDPRVRVR